MNIIQITKPEGQQWKRLLGTVVTVLKYKKISIYHGIYIKVFSDRNFPYITVSTDDVINTANNETSFTELRKVFEYYIYISPRSICI